MANTMTGVQDNLNLLNNVFLNMFGITLLYLYAKLTGKLYQDEDQMCWT